MHDKAIEPQEDSVPREAVDERGIVDDRAPRTCRFCRPVKEQVFDYRCVLCDPREGDLIGV